MLGQSLAPAVESDSKIRDYALFGYHGCHINIMDGQHVYMRSPVLRGSEKLYEYTLMPTRINRRFTPQEMEGTECHSGFKFTKGCPVLKIPATFIIGLNAERFGNRFYDLETDSGQNEILVDDKNVVELLQAMRTMMEENDASEELYERYAVPEVISLDFVTQERDNYLTTSSILDELQFERPILNGAAVLLQFLNSIEDEATEMSLIDHLKTNPTQDSMFSFVDRHINKEHHPMLYYPMSLEMRIN